MAMNPNVAIYRIATIGGSANFGRRPSPEEKLARPRPGLSSPQALSAPSARFLSSVTPTSDVALGWPPTLCTSHERFVSVIKRRRQRRFGAKQS
jgi:hypothetical protein